MCGATLAGKRERRTSHGGLRRGEDVRARRPRTQGAGIGGAALATADAADYSRRMNTESAPEFDTLAAARKLEAAGVDREQAKAHTEALRDSRAGSVTKACFDVALEAALARQDRRTLLVGLSIAALLFAAMKYL